MLLPMKTPIEQLLIAADVYCAAVKRAPSTVATSIFNDGQKFVRLHEGADVSTRSHARAMRWLSDHWPPDTAWPAEVERPRHPFERGALPLIYIQAVRRLRDARVRAGGAQIEMAETIGVTQQQLSNYERGNIIPNADIFVAWMGALGFTLEEPRPDIQNACPPKIGALTDGLAGGNFARPSAFLPPYGAGDREGNPS